MEISCWELGVSGEAGDIASCIKKLIFHKNESIKDGIKENIGDMMWYTAMICNWFEWNFEEILDENIKKLKDLIIFLQSGIIRFCLLFFYSQGNIVIKSNPFL